MRHSAASLCSGWVADLRAAGCASVLAVEWKPGAPSPGHWPRTRKRKAGAKSSGVAEGGGGGVSGKGGGGGRGCGGGDGGRDGVVRLFAFGKEAARRKVRSSIDWEDGLDWFVA